MSRQAHEMGGFKRNGVVLLILVAAVSGFGYIPSIPKICINQGYGGVAHFTSVGSSRGYDLFPPNGMNSMSLAGGGGGNWGRRGGRGGGGGHGGGGDDENARMEGDGCRYSCCYCNFRSVLVLIVRCYRT